MRFAEQQAWHLAHLRPITKGKGLDCGRLVSSRPIASLTRAVTMGVSLAWQTHREDEGDHASESGVA
jgi:hypothetical protein